MTDFYITLTAACYLDKQRNPLAVVVPVPGSAPDGGGRHGRRTSWTFDKRPPLYDNERESVRKKLERGRGGTAPCTMCLGKGAGGATQRARQRAAFCNEIDGGDWQHCWQARCQKEGPSALPTSRPKVTTADMATGGDMVTGRAATAQPRCCCLHLDAVVQVCAEIRNYVVHTFETRS